MIIGVKRFLTSPGGTFGRLTIDGAEAGYTLELPWNGGQNRRCTDCIPPGLYVVTIDFSSRFKRLMPRLLDVPGRDGILIHPGNTEANTEGCLLVAQVLAGTPENPTGILNSRIVFNPLFRSLQDAQAQGEENDIAISNNWNTPAAIPAPDNAAPPQNGV